MPVQNTATVSFTVFNGADASSQTIAAATGAMNEMTDDISEQMEISSTVAKEGQDWSHYFDGLLSYDQKQITGSGAPLEQAQAQFNTDNTAATAAATGYSTTNNQLSQQVTATESGYNTAANLAQTAGVGLSQFVVQNWVI
jgi:hypothetical protein